MVDCTASPTTPQKVALTLIDRDQRCDVVEFLFADPSHKHQVLNAPKRTMLRAMLDDALGDHAANSGKQFQVFGGRVVDVYPVDTDGFGS